MSLEATVGIFGLFLTRLLSSFREETGLWEGASRKVTHEGYLTLVGKEQ
jgi:hypothetical protein